MKCRERAYIGKKCSTKSDFWKSVEFFKVHKRIKKSVSVLDFSLSSLIVVEKSFLPLSLVA